MDDIIKEIYEAETNEIALQILQNRYNELNNNTEDIIIADNDNNAIEVHKGFLSNNSKVFYAQSYGARYRTDFYDDLVFFTNYIRDNRIMDKITFINVLPRICIKYFGAPSSTEDVREEAIQELLSKTTTDEEYFEIINNSNITMYKGLGIAQCSEFATLTSILASLAGFESYYIMGESLIGNINDGHAFNVVKFSNDCLYLMDNSHPHYIYDENNNLIDARPNFYEIQEDVFESFLANKINLTVPLYNGKKMPDGSIKKIDYKNCEYISGKLKNKGVKK